MSKRIVSSIDLSTYGHLGDLETCTDCGYKQEFMEWAKTASILALDIVRGKHGSVVLVMECPKCFEFMWFHMAIPLSIYDEVFPPAWIEATTKEFNKRCLFALRQWKKGVCGNCKLLESGEISTHAWRNCPKGTGPAEMNCTKWRPHD